MSVIPISSFSSAPMRSALADGIAILVVMSDRFRGLLAACRGLPGPPAREIGCIDAEAGVGGGRLKCRPVLGSDGVAAEHRLQVGPGDVDALGSCSRSAQGGNQIPK